MTSDPVVARKDGALIRLRVAPNAKGPGLEGRVAVGALELKVAAPPVGGKANDEVERFVAGAETVREVLAPRPR